MSLHTTATNGLSESRDRLQPEAKGAAEPDFRDKLTEFVIRHRWATVVPVVLPLSKVYDAYWTLRHVHYRNLTRRASAHGERVRSVSEQIKRWNAAGRPGLLHTSRKGWQSV